jgi:hypothetical protein
MEVPEIPPERVCNLEPRLSADMHCFILGDADRDPNGDLYHLTVVVGNFGNLNKVRRHAPDNQL